MLPKNYCYILVKCHALHWSHKYILLSRLWLHFEFNAWLNTNMALILSNRRLLHFLFFIKRNCRNFHLNLHQDFTLVKQFRTCSSLWFVFYQLLVPLENGSRGRARTFNISVNSRTLYHWATLELKWLPRKDSHLHKNVNSVPCYFDTTRELKIKFESVDSLTTT